MTLSEFIIIREGAEPVWFRRLVVVDFGKAEVRKRLRIPGPVADVAAVPEATSASYSKRLAPRRTEAGGSGGGMR
jgi:hypothetical protein